MSGKSITKPHLSLFALFSKESFRRAVKTLTAPDCEQENVFRQEVQTPGSVSLCEGVLGLQQLHLTRVP